MEITTLLMLTGIVTLYLYTIRNFNHWRNKGIPYIKPWPLVGSCPNLLLFRTTIGEYFKKIYFESQSPVLGFFIGDKPCLLIRSRELIQSILIKDFSFFYDRTVAQNKSKDPIGSNILFCVKNPDWRNIRTKVGVLFSSGKLRNMFKLMNDVGEDLSLYIERNVIDKANTNTKELCGKYASDVISTCSFGIKSNCFEYQDAEFNTFAKRVFMFDWSQGVQMTCSFIMPTLFKYTRMTFIDGLAGQFFERTFRMAIEEREKSKAARNDLIDILIKIKNDNMKDEKEKIEYIKLISQLAQFFIAGFETTSSTISFALWELSRNQQIQNKLRTEIRKVIAGCGNFTYDNIQQIEYLKMVVQETLRKYPVLPYLDRATMSNYTLPNTDIVIEKGTPVYIPVLGLHYDPHFFPEPEKFIPERFEGNNKKSLSFVYLAFGDGPRNCIGERFGYLSVQVGLVHILSKYKVEPTALTPKVLKFNTKAFLMTTLEGIPLKFSSVA